MWRSLLLGLWIAQCPLLWAEEPQSEAKKPPYERLLQGDDARRASDLYQKIEQAEKADQYDEAIRHTEELAALRKKVQGADHWQSVYEEWDLDRRRKLRALSPEARSDWRKAVQDGTDARRLLEARHFDEALVMQENCRRRCEQLFGVKYPDTVACYVHAGVILRSQGRHVEALSAFETALEVRRSLFGETHPSTAFVYDNLGQSLNGQRNYADAHAQFKKAVEILREVLGDKHGDTFRIYDHLVGNLNKLIDAAEQDGKYDEVLKHSRELLTWRQNMQGAEHWQTVNERWNVDARQKLAALSAEDLAGWRLARQGFLDARQLKAKGEYAKAELLLQENLRWCLQVLGEKHLGVANRYGHLGDVHYAQGKYADAEPFYRKALELCRELVGEKNPETALWCNNLAVNFEKLQKFDDARQLYQTALGLYREVRGEKHPDTVNCFHNLVRNLNTLAERAEQEDRYDDSIRFSEELLALRSKRQGADHWETVDARWVLDAFRKVAALPTEERAAWRNLLKERSAAEQLNAQGQYAKTEPLHREYNQRCVQVFGENHPYTAVSNNSLAVNLHNQRNFAEARRLYERALELMRGLKGEKHPDTALYYYNLGLSFDAEGKYADAETYFQKTFDLRRELFGEKHGDTAAAGERLALSLKSQTKLAQAEPLFQKVLEVRRELLGEKHSDTATGYSNLATCLKDEGRYAEAEALYRKALDVCRELLGEKHARTAICYNNLALVLQEQGKYGAADGIYRKILELRRELLGETHLDTAASYGHLGTNLHFQGKYADAETAHRKALEIRLGLLGEKHPDTAISYNNLAVNLSDQGKLADAQAMHQKVLEIRREVLGEKHPQTATSYNNLAHSLYEQRKYADAQPLYEKALQIYRELLGETHPDTLGCCNNLAANLDSQAKYAEAELLYRSVLDLRREGPREKQPETALSYGNLASNLSDQGRHTEAQPLFERALELRREVLGENHPDTATSYSNLAHNLSRQAKYADAQQLYEKALALRRELLGEKHLDTVASYTSLAVNLAGQRRYSDALPNLTEAAAGYEAARLNVAPRGLHRAVYGAEHSPYRLLAAVQARLLSPTAAWNAAEADLARGLIDEIASRRGTTLTADERDRQALLTMRLQQARDRRLQLLTLSDPSESDQEELAALQAERTTLEAELSDLAAAVSLRELATLPQVQRAIPADAALVLWLDVSSGSAVEEHWGCVVRQTGEPRWERLPGSGPEGEWTAGDAGAPGMLRLALASQTFPAAGIESLAQKLHEQRMAPLVRHLDGIKSLYVVGVSEMAGIPVEVLTRGFTVSYIPSGTFLARLAGRPPLGKLNLLALGDPAPARENAGSESPRPTGFPGTRIEVVLLAGLFGDQATLLVDSAASEQTLDKVRKKGDLARFRYLHFAANVAASDDKAFESAVVLAQDKLPSELVRRTGEPLLDGRLSANEVLEFWKLNSELVTLSASETALGQSGGGDGPLGFAQAFLTSGSRAVCLSLWRVEDAATTLLMIRFYQNLLGKRPGLDKPMPKALALAEAKDWLRELSAPDALKIATAAARDASRKGGSGTADFELLIPGIDPTQVLAKDLKPFSDPRFWSAFVLIGDPN